MAATNKIKEPMSQVTREAARKKYPVGKLRENCRQLFGVSDNAFAGATYGMMGTYTIEEMKAHIEAWKKKGVK